MNLHEYQSREILAKHGIPVPPGILARSVEEAVEAASSLDYPVVIKAQVHSGGRGKAGGIKLVNSQRELEYVAPTILSMNIGGRPVSALLVVPAADIQKEYYLSVVLDRELKTFTLIASAEGGVDIEEVAREHPDSILRVPAHPWLGLQPYQARELAYKMGFEGSLVRTFVEIAMSLYRCALDVEASLVEINPLAKVSSGDLVALDSKIVVDDNSLFRHPDIAEMRDLSQEETAEVEASRVGISYIKLDGNIGCMVNGAGLAMATMDLVKLYGGSPANFLDIGGGAHADQVEAAMNIILSDEKVSAVLINIFGGITRCDDVARGIVEGLRNIKREVPIVVRLVGTNEEEGHRILEDAGLRSLSSLEEAAKLAVELASKSTVSR